MILLRCGVQLKRKTIISLSLLILFIVLIFGVVYLNNPDMFDKGDGNVVDGNKNVSIVRYPILTGEVTHTYSVDGGQVISGNPEMYLSEISVDNVSDSNFKLLKKKGEDIAPNEPLYMYNGSKKSVNFNGKVVEVYFQADDNTRTAVISLLNYDKLFIDAYIDKEKIDMIDYNTKVKAVVNGEEYDTSIKTIGYEITDGKLPIQIELPKSKHFLPGTEAQVTFILDTVEMGMYVPEEAVFQDGDVYYVNVETGDEYGYEQKQITVGEHFEIEENGDMQKYVEIISGVSEKDILVVENIDDSGPKIKEKVKNE